MRVIPPIEILPATFTRASTGTYSDAAGVLQTAAVDVPRFGYGYADEPEGGPLVNLIPYSETFASWSKAFLSVLTDDAAGPESGTAADKLVEDATLNGHYVQISCSSVVVGQQVTYWADIAPAGRTHIQLRIYNGGAFSADKTGTFNLATGGYTITGTGVTATATALAGGYWRLAVTVAATATGVVTVGVILNNAGGGSNYYTGDGFSGAYIARAQVNYGPVPQDYIETNGEFGYTPPAWVFKGLLQEATATNQMAYSQDLTNTGVWTGPPSRTLTGKTWHGVPFVAVRKTTAVASEGVARGTVPVTVAGESRTLTVALLADTSTKLQIGMYGGVSAWGAGYDDTYTWQVLEGPGVITGSGNALGTIESLHSVHPTVVQLTRQINRVESVVIYFYPDTSTSAVLGKGVQVTRVQVTSTVDNGGSYIPTVAATVTRAADVMGTGMISSLPEPDSYTGELVWAGGTAYTVGQKVARATTHRTYQRLVAGTTATVPELDPVNWFDLQPDNKFAMFDLTDNTASVASGAIHFAVKSGLRTNSLFLGGVVGTDVQTVVEAPGTDPYTNSQNLRLRKTTGWYSYFFGGFAYRKAVALLDLPPLTTATVSVSITNTGAGGTACAAAVLGKNVFIGLAEYNAQRKARNFSTVTRDEFGKATLVKRRSIPTTQQTLWIEKELADTILEMNELLNATPAAWLGLDEPEDGYFNALQIVGVYQEFDIDVSYPNNARVNLKLEEI